MSDLEIISGNFIKIKRQFSDINYSYQILDIWPEIVGQQFSKNTSAERFVKGILYISVNSNTWLNQVNFFKIEIMNKYNKHFEKEVIKDIKFFLNKNNNNNSESKNYKNKINKNINLESLPTEDKDYINKCTSSIEDEDLKNKLEKFFSVVRRKEITLINKGWKKCKKCSNLFNENEDICKLCRKEIN